MKGASIYLNIAFKIGQIRSFEFLETHFQETFYWIDMCSISYRHTTKKIFQSRGGFVKLGYSDKHFVKNSRKKGPTGKNFEVFSLRYS